MDRLQHWCYIVIGRGTNCDMPFWGFKSCLLRLNWQEKSKNSISLHVQFKTKFWSLSVSNWHVLTGTGWTLGSTTLDTCLSQCHSFHVFYVVLPFRLTDKTCRNNHWQGFRYQKPHLSKTNVSISLCFCLSRSSQLFCLQTMFTVVCLLCEWMCQDVTQQLLKFTLFNQIKFCFN